MRSLPSPALLTLALLLVLLPTQWPVAFAQDPVDASDLGPMLDAFLHQEVTPLDIPGLVFVVVKDDEVLFAGGYGLAHVEDQIPMHPEETVMRIGSVSKLFVATAVMQLVEHGKLDLEADVTTYLDGFRVRDRFSEPVTLAHLLSHTAGFGDHWSNTTDPEKVQPLGDYLAAHMPPRFVPPGEMISYSNHGYALAAHVVEAVTGLPFDRYVRDHILRPLGMAHSGYLLGPPFPEGLATGYLYSDGEHVPQPIDYDDDYPGGSIYATAADMARFMIAHLQGGCYREACILRPDTVAEMQRQQFAHHPELPGWTYGFEETFSHGQRAIGHGGATRGFTSDLFLLPEHGLGYFLSVNHESSGAVARMLGRLEDQIMDHLFPDETAAQETSTGRDLQRFAGRYRYTRHYRHTVSKISVLDGELEVTVLGRRLMVRGRAYAPAGPGLFQEVGGKRRIAFQQDARGRVSFMYWGPYAYRRLPWYERAAFQRFLFESTGWVWVALGALWPLMCLLRRLRQGAREPWLLRRACWLVVLMVVLNGAFLLSLRALFWRSPETQRALLALPLASLAAGVGVLLVSGVMWWRRMGSLGGRIYYTLAGIGALLFAWFLDYWNLLGYHLG